MIKGLFQKIPVEALKKWNKRRGG